ncbi:hypothetical protein BDM02DRAFT_3132451 [Thelephora ganbajun]|uniref:Uncharacterized protein n=1 Tax=Thelephora ganbajun TaxID=370292 RepID=A0ACB6Z2R4_THEGA|nr:hypothetical protein BDM02DRAFT_3132451 [Thelephora ganbajun]
MAPAVCPNCRLIFKDSSAVLKHMNHHYSSCHLCHIFDLGPGFLGWFRDDEDAEAQSRNPYHPFLSKGEWELAGFLSCSGLLMKLIDDFLSLDLISGLGLSFHCAQTLRGKIELLPSRPSWKSTTIQYQPHQDFDTSGNRVYSEWITSDGAWDLQSRLPPYATLLGVTLSSDKTRLSMMTGDRVAHPLLVTLANIDSALRSSISSHAFSLLALFPIPKFIGVKKGLHGILENQLTHLCLDFITHSLKVTSQHGVWLSDCAGKIQYCFTPLVAYIVDTPEATALTGIAGKTSHLTMATYKDFGDPFDPSEVAVYTGNTKTMFRLNGVDLPFWCNWCLPDGTLPNPYQVFLIEILHHLHKSFWDHDVKWAIRAPCNGYRHFSSGISSLKQVTGHEHRDIQRYLLTLIPDGVDERFVLCIWALLDLWYFSQLNQVTKDDLHVGKRGPINHFEIPKLELLQSIVSCIQWSGALPQWSADITEHLHIVYIKMPHENTNGHDYPPQICRNLNHQEKCRHFDLATRLEEAISTEPDLASQANDPDEIFNTQANGNMDWKSKLPDIAQAFGPPQAITNLFAITVDS